MDFEPQKFFVGLMDFFSILLPGALLTFLLSTQTRVMEWGALRDRLAGPKGWIAFLVASYLLGHFAFLLSSLLDDLYDQLRKKTVNAQIRQVVRRKRNFRWWIRAMVWLIFKRERDLAVERAGKIKQRALARLRAQKAINNFQWCKALLAKESPESLSAIQRFEADSKFFRCFIVVLLVMIVLAWPAHNWILAVAGAGLLPLATLRYMEQRLKATNQAYWSVITLTARTGEMAIPADAGPTSEASHAGGVVFRKRWRRGVEYLLVEASKNSDEWVLPKGKIEPGEDKRETAVREVHEETGVWAKIHGRFDPPISYSVDGEPVAVQMYLMEQVARGFCEDRTRRKTWLPLGVAKERAKYDEAKKYLDLAEQYRPR